MIYVFLIPLAICVHLYISSIVARHQFHRFCIFWRQTWSPFYKPTGLNFRQEQNKFLLGSFIIGSLWFLTLPVLIPYWTMRPLECESCDSLSGSQEA